MKNGQKHCLADEHTHAGRSISATATFFLFIFICSSVLPAAALPKFQDGPGRLG
jgi:hypothetical protein